MNMNQGVRSTFLKSVAITVLLGIANGAAAATLPEMINKAGMQRMLTQRIVKAYAQLVINVDSRASRAQLNDAVSLFDRHLAELEQEAPNESVRAGLNDVRRLWGPFKSIANGPIDRAGMKQLSATDDALLARAHEVVIRLQDTAGTAQAHLVNVAGRERMLSQRIAKFYMLLSAGLQGAELHEQMQRARYEFEGALADLRSAPEDTAEIRRGLAEVDRQWIVFRTSFQLDEGQYIPLLVARAAEKILTQMDQVTAMYQRLGN